ncbi:MAG: hypothetical protein AAFQ82_22580, partial [Myxococcota bacterium]
FAWVVCPSAASPETSARQSAPSAQQAPNATAREKSASKTFAEESEYNPGSIEGFALEEKGGADDSADRVGTRGGRSESRMRNEASGGGAALKKPKPLMDKRPRRKAKRARAFDDRSDRFAEDLTDSEQGLGALGYAQSDDAAEIAPEPAEADAAIDELVENEAPRRAPSKERASAVAQNESKRGAERDLPAQPEPEAVRSAPPPAPSARPQAKTSVGARPMVRAKRDHVERVGEKLELELNAVGYYAIVVRYRGASGQPESRVGTLKPISGRKTVSVEVRGRGQEILVLVSRGRFNPKYFAPWAAYRPLPRKSAVSSTVVRAPIVPTRNIDPASESSSERP